MFWKLMQLSKARSAARSHDWSTAATYYEKIYRSDNNDVKALIQLAHALKEQGDIDAAKNKYAEAANKFERHSDAQRQAGLFFLRLGQHEEAKVFLERHLSIDPSVREVFKFISIGDNTSNLQEAEGREVVFINDKVLQEEDWLNLQQRKVFKYLSGSLSYKD